MVSVHLQRTWHAVGLPLTTLAMMLAVAELAKHAGLLPVFVPAPSEVGAVVRDNPALVYANIGATLYKAAAGYAAAAVVAIAVASIAVLVRSLHGTIYNIGVGLHSIPIIATAPLLALWLGNGPQVQIAIAALASQFPMLVGAMQGLRAADAKQRELMHVLSASPLQTLRYLLIPGALPYIFAGFKVAAPAAVLGAITAEWAGADRGVGALMLYALFSYDTPKVWLAVVLTCLLAAGGYGLWALAEKILVPWDRGVELGD
jgi:ABC-type nitrate/sulfonate/bicarbonate transport system permease component